ncbi:MAG: HPP family protein [Gammaproteobacteria bacterium]|nr:HPP family protein [Gammaproteobacteria bacterium]
MSLHNFFETIGFSAYKSGNGEVLVSVVGGLVGILGIFLVSEAVFGHEVSVMIVPSMGASAVLLFAAPHAPFSQPWNVMVGHLLSAVIGIACWQWVPQIALAASAAVGLAIGAMYITRSLHPPGGATALAAVIGTEELHGLGFGYVFQPILVNVVVILLVAILFNGLFKWRRYPAHLQVQVQPESSEVGGYAPINHEDFVYALSQIDTIVDASEDDLLKIYHLATKRHQQTLLEASDE